ncbi:MAG TPA: 3'-5' exonuclease [bacterium]|nr:3'-5' exonuclease [bacterium]
MRTALAERTISELEFVFIDTETTGFSPRAGGELVELAGVRTRDGVVLDRFQRLIRPTRPIPQHVTRIHGITNAMVAGAPPAGEVLDEFLHFAADAIWVFHNARFDLAFIIAAAQAAGLTLPDTAIIDTLTMSRKLYPNLRHALVALAERFGVDQPEAHRALCDAETTWQLFTIFVRDNWTAAPPTFAAIGEFAWFGTLADTVQAAANRTEV